jgi:hypothetical protein
MTYVFTIAHATEGRTRIRWAGAVSEKAIISKLAESIAEIHDVDQATPRLTTGSIIIEHEHADWTAIESRLSGELSLVFQASPAPRSGVQVLNHGLDSVDATLKGMNLDLSSVTVILLLIMAIAQAARGQVTGNATSFLWYALSIASVARNSSATKQQDPAMGVAE